MEPSVYLPYDILVYIFQLLNFRDLTRVARVNKFWNEASKNKGLWMKFVPGEEITITNVNLMMEFLLQRGIKYMDLTRVKFIELNFEKYLPKGIKLITSLETLKLPKCNENTVEHLFVSNHKLQVLHMSHINKSERELNLINISQFSKLKELRISDPFAMVKDFSPIATLKYLTVLELPVTMFKNCEFLLQLKYLKSLTAGYSEPFPDISILLNLKKLRLALPTHLNDLSKFFELIQKIKTVNQLEILNVNLHDNSSLEKLKKCKNIEKLLIALSSFSPKSNSNILNTMPFLLNLKEFAWGLHPPNNSNHPVNCILVYQNHPGCFEIDSDQNMYYFTVKGIFEYFKKHMPQLSVSLHELQSFGSLFLKVFE